jgi:hypothetical protein
VETRKLTIETERALVYLGLAESAPPADTTPSMAACTTHQCHPPPQVRVRNVAEIIVAVKGRRGPAQKGVDGWLERAATVVVGHGGEGARTRCKIVCCVTTREGGGRGWAGAAAVGSLPPAREHRSPTRLFPSWRRTAASTSSSSSAETNRETWKRKKKKDRGWVSFLPHTVRGG